MPDRLSDSDGDQTVLDRLHREQQYVSTDELQSLMAEIVDPAPGSSN